MHIGVLMVYSLQIERGFKYENKYVFSLTKRKTRSCSSTSSNNCILSIATLIKAIIIVLINCYVNISSQIVNDFTITDSGSVPSIATDLNGEIYVTWENLGDAVYLKHLDNKGNSIGSTIRFASTFASLFPNVAANSKYTVVTWEDRLSNTVSFFKTYVVGNISTNNALDSNNYVMFNNNPETDAIRTRPNVNFLNDTTFIVTWSGNGDSNIVRSGVYGQIATASGKKIGDNFLISDHVNDSIDSFNSRVIYKGNNNYFIVTWEDNFTGRFNIYGRKFNTNGMPIGSSFLISNDTTMTYIFYYSIAKDTAGNFVVVWIADKGKKSQMEWRWYNSKGTSLTNVETLTPLDTVINSGSTVDASIDETGKIIIEWEQSTADGTKIYGQRFLADRIKLGNPFKISNNINRDNQIYANVVLTYDTIFSVWQENGIKGNFLDFNKVTSISNSNLKVDKINSYYLYPNYPNPFNPSTIIHYEIPNDGLVTLKIYDELGREVKTLVNQYQIKGRYDINFDAGNLASGIYFYRLNVINPLNQSQNFTAVKKMLLLK